MPTILLTGATGMVGREVLARLCRDPRYERVSCLVRPSGSESAQARLDAVLGKVGVAADFMGAVFRKLGRRPPLRVRPMAWRKVVRPALARLPSKKLRRTLRTGLAYRPYLELRLRFDTTEADRALGRTSVRCPAVLEYIDTIVDAALKSDFGRR